MHDSMMDIMASMSEIQALQSTNEVETIEAYRQMNKAAALREALDRKEA